MVSKLLLASQECFFSSVEESAEMALKGRLKDHYYEIKAGIGLYKSPELYGAFPTDPYSHTPGNAGVKQPGMTGQVKEDFISRMGELGVRIEEGKIRFDTSLLNRNEFLQQDALFRYINPEGIGKQIKLKSKQLAFTICQVPVVYQISDSEKISIHLANEEMVHLDGNVLDNPNSRKIFSRSGEILQLNIDVMPGK
jgi:hypothetical protein